MSRPRSRSPCYRLSPRWHDDRRDGGGRGPPRNFPSDRPDVDPHWNGPRFDNHRLRPKEDPDKPWAGFREEGGPGGRRRPSGSPPDPHRHRRAPLEELRRRTPSPPPFGSVDRRRLSPDHELRNRGRGRGGFGEDPPRYGDQQREKFGEVAGSPQRLPRERLPSAGSRKTGGSQAGGAWGREEGRSRPRSPREMSQDRRRERSSGELGRGGLGKPREDHNPPPHHHHPLHQRERSPFPDRLRKELEDEVHHG